MVNFSSAGSSVNNVNIYNNNFNNSVNNINIDNKGDIELLESKIDEYNHNNNEINRNNQLVLN